MGGKAPSAPPAPDPMATATAQTQMNKDTAITNARLNMVNQVTPYGSLTYQETMGADGTPRFTATQTLSPSEQRMLDLTNQGQETYGRAAVKQLGAVENTLSTPFAPDFSAIGNPMTAREDVQAALLDRMRPSLERQRAGLENQLRNQGVNPGSQAWIAAMDDLNRSENDARYGAIINAGNEQSRLIGTQGQLLQQQLATRSQPLNEANALLTGAQVQMPQFVDTPNVTMANTDYLGAVGLQQQALQNAFNAKNANYQANLQGLYGLGSAALGAAGRFGSAAMMPTPAPAPTPSDRRLKENIREVGRLANGLPVYAYTYRGDDTPRIGLMAQDVARVRPEAVELMPSGFLGVHYDRAVV